MIIKKHKKAISTFIATLLLMVLAVSAGVIIYAYVMGYLGGFTGTSQTMGAMSIDSASLSTTAMNVYIRNIGHTAINFDKAYVNGANATFTAAPDPVLEGGVALVTITQAFTASKTYEFRLIAQDNTQITFNLKTGGTSGSPPGTYSLTVTTSGSGTVTLNPAGGSYAPGTNVTLTAVPAAGYSFTGWSGALSGTTNPDTITMDGAKAVTASFAMFYKTVTFGAGAVGTQANFPALISIQNDLQIAAKSTNGAEIYFTSDAAGTSILDHDLLSYSEDVSGADVAAWVKVPSLTSGGMIYVWYGGSSPAVENPTGVWDGNYRGVWHLEEDGNTNPLNYQDATINNKDGTGTQMTAASDVTGKVGIGQYFDGSGDFITIDGTGALNYGAPLTVEAWVKYEWANPPTNNWSGWFLGKCGADGPSTIDWKLRGLGFSAGKLWYNTASGDITYMSTGTVTQGIWAHVAATVSGTTLQLYINGVPAAGGSFSGFTGVNGGIQNLFIGKGIATECYKGTVDEVRVSNTARLAPWIQTEYNNMNSPGTFISVSLTEYSLPP